MLLMGKQTISIVMSISYVKLPEDISGMGVFDTRTMGLAMTLICEIVSEVRCKIVRLTDLASELASELV